MRSLRFRLIFSHIIPLLIILPVIGTVLVYLLETQWIASNYAAELTRQAVLVADFASGTSEIWLEPGRAQAFVSIISSRLAGKVMLLDPAGRLVVSSDESDDNRIGQTFIRPDLEHLITESSQAKVNYDQSAVKDITVPVVNYDGRLMGYVLLVNPLAEVYQRSLALRTVMLWVLGGGLLAGVVLGWMLSADLARQLRTATRAVTSLTSGGRLETLKEQGVDEIRLLYRAFNQMVERLRNLEENRKKLLANLVHEIGRPLGALQSAAQALKGGAQNDEALREELISGIQTELHRLTHLLDDLARLHEQVIGSLELKLKPVAVSEWLPGVINTYRAAAADKRIEFSAEIPADLPTIAMDADRLAQAVENLVANAIKYTSPGGRVLIQANVEETMLAIRVKDNGLGITPDEQQRIFTPFFRGNAASRFPQGMGLGLTIARDLVQAHNGTLVVESEVGKGSSFTIFLPIGSKG